MRMSLVNGETGYQPTSHTNKMTKSGSQLNLGLNKRVAIVLEGNEKDLFHLVG